MHNKTFTPEEIKLLSEPLTNRDLAARLNKTVKAVRQKRAILGIPAPKQSEPTQQEIAERSAKVREKWSPGTERRRRTIGKGRFSIPLVNRPVLD